MTVLDYIGWAGVVLLIVSLLQSRMMRLRVLNLISCVILVGYNAALGVWPMVGMNAAVAVIDLWFIVRLQGASKSATGDRADSLQAAPAAQLLEAP